MAELGFQEHDHTACIHTALRVAEDHCAQYGMRMTAGRRRVLEILLSEHRALGAYEILDVMAEDGARVAPPAVYRALDFLVANGFAHKVETLNAFVACAHPGKIHDPALLICNTCRRVLERRLPKSAKGLDSVADASGFEMHHQIIEAEGLCGDCRAAT